jgi:sec-independent protein translocase protein TatA
MPLLAGIGPLGVPELLIIAFIILLIFGVGRLPEVFGGLGKGIKEFRKESQADGSGTPADPASTLNADISAAAPSAATGDAFCTECGARNAAGARFCASCGKSLTASVS